MALGWVNITLKYELRRLKTVGIVRLSRIWTFATYILYCFILSLPCIFCTFWWLYWYVRIVSYKPAIGWQHLFDLWLCTLCKICWWHVNKQLLLLLWTRQYLFLRMNNLLHISKVALMDLILYVSHHYFFFYNLATQGQILET